jgi:hypothetical protein
LIEKRKMERNLSGSKGHFIPSLEPGKDAGDLRFPVAKQAASQGQAILGKINRKCPLK